MSSVTSPKVRAEIGARIQHLLLRPKLEWPVIEAEQATVNSVLVPYAVLLSAIGPLAGLIGGQLFPLRIFSVVYRPSLAGSIGMALLGWGLMLVSVYLLGLIINALAPNFEGQQNRVQAMKLAVYSMTAFWLASIFSLFPGLMWLGILLGLYSIYLLFLGLPLLMRAPQDKAFVYTIVVVIAWLILWLIGQSILGNMISGGLLATGDLTNAYLDNIRFGTIS